MLNKRKFISDIPEEDLKTYMAQYYDGLKKNKSNAEMKWLEAIKELFSSDIKSGKEVKKLQTEAVFSRFDIPAEFRIIIDLENKVSRIHSVKPRNRPSVIPATKRQQRHYEIIQKMQ